MSEATTIAATIGKQNKKLYDYVEGRNATERWVGWQFVEDD